MGRLRRFPDHRFVGLRDTMKVYDCDDPILFELVSGQAEDLSDQNGVQVFGPDTLVEACNRGFRPADQGR